MADSVQIASFVGGELRVTSSDEKSSEAVLALPLSHLLVRLVRVPAENREDPVGYATPLLQAQTPFPDEPLTVSCETIRSDESGLVVLAAALPEGATEVVGEALDGAKLDITRVDVLALGQLRELWPQIEDGRKGLRRLVILVGTDEYALFVLSGDEPIALRGVSLSDNLSNEVLKTLLEAEAFGGARPLDEIVVFGEWSPETLKLQVPTRVLPLTTDGVAGIAARSQEEDTLDARPASWREMLEETRFKSKLKHHLTIALGIWGVIMLVLFGVPMVYNQLAAHQQTLCKEHARKYAEVREMKAKVDLVRKYSDHDKGALEILKAVSDRLPEGVELDSWNFVRDEEVRLSGESDEASGVYALKDALEAITFGSEDDESSGERLFKTVELNGPRAGKGGRQKFDLTCGFKEEEAE